MALVQCGTELVRRNIYGSNHVTLQKVQGQKLAFNHIGEYKAP